jgi:hypothetical protein
MAVEKTEKELEAEASKEVDSKDGDESPSNDELADAFDKLLAEDEEPVDEPDVEVDEAAKKIADEQTQDDNAEKSRLGRKVKAMEEERKKDRELLEEVLALLKAPKKTVTSKEEQLDEGDEEEKALKTYQATYRELVKGYAKDADYEEVLAVLKTNPEFDKIHTGKPEVDVEINYNKAARSLLAKRLKASAEKKVDVHGDEETAATGLSGSGRQAKPVDKEYELDEFAKEFVSKTKMSKEDIGKALAGDIPLNLRGTK